MKLYYYNDTDNAGDFFASWLLRKFNKLVEFSNNAEIAITGSILAWPQVKHAKIWGCGFHNFEDKYFGNKDNIYAVRGKLTADKLNLQNVVTGEPGLLVSRFYKPSTIKKYKFGIVAHYIDYDFFSKLNLPSYVKVINMGTIDIEKLMDEIYECEFVLSSSLHGIVFAHSYGIPAIRIKHKELTTKNAFKFLDYYSNFKIKFLQKEIKTQADLDWNEFEILYKSRILLTPSLADVEKIQNNLLSVFPG